MLCEYFDDICTHTYTIDEPHHVLDKPVTILQQYGFKVDIMCQFPQSHIKFLGYIITHQGKAPEPEGPAAVEKCLDVLCTVQGVNSVEVSKENIACNGRRASYHGPSPSRGGALPVTPPVLSVVSTQKYVCGAGMERSFWSIIVSLGA